MLLRILGSAAGGGFPQWNCRCRNCRIVRKGNGRAHPRTQSSLAVRAGSGPWYLVNASPDVRQQLELLAGDDDGAQRASPFAGVLLTDAEIDHTAGLSILRESDRPLPIAGTEEVRRCLTEGYPLLPTLEGYCGVKWQTLESEKRLTLGDGAEGGVLDVEPFALPADPPLYMRELRAQGIRSEEAALGLTFREPSTGAIATYVPGLEEATEPVLERLAGSDCVLVDGTFWRDDELPSLGIGTRTARAMGHLPLSGPGGSLEWLSRLERPRKILVHINNTNPILLEDSPERRAVEAAGVEVSYDGMTIEL